MCLIQVMKTFCGKVGRMCFRNTSLNEETVNVSIGVLVDSFFATASPPPYTITKNDSDASMVIYTLSISSKSL